MIYDVIVLGSGPAGLTAAIYSVRGSLKTLVIAGYKQGGQLMLTTKVENFPGFPDGIEGPQLMMNMRKQAENLGVEFIDKDAVDIDVNNTPFKVYTEKVAEVDSSIFSGVKIDSSKIEHVSPQLSGYETKSLIIATGADTKWLGVPGEKELIGKGVSSCAPCDAFFFRNKNVAVIGGGDSAMEEANVLANVANSVTIIYRGDKFRASKVMQEKVIKNPKIKVIWNTVVVEVLGTEKVTGLKLKTTSPQPSTEGEGEKIVPSPLGEGQVEVFDFSIDGVFVAIGHIPNTNNFIGKIDLDEKGFVKRKEIFENGLLKYWSATNIDGVFVAGDVNDYRYMQAVTAAGFASKAAAINVSSKVVILAPMI